MHTFQNELVQAPHRHVILWGARRRIRRAPHHIHRRAIALEQLVQQLLRRRQYLLRQLTDQILRELLELVPLELGEGLGDGRPELDTLHIENPVQAHGNNVRAPRYALLGAGAVARGHPLPVAHDRDAREQAGRPAAIADEARGALACVLKFQYFISVILKNAEKIFKILKFF